jgi:hypothetical protein
MRLLSLLVAWVLLQSSFAPASAKADSQDGTPPVSEPPEPRDGDVYIPYWGRVTELTCTSITIQFDNQKGLKPKQFLASETLAAGKIPLEPRPKPLQRQTYSVMPSSMYRLTDVKVGDWVLIHYTSLNGVDICDHIRIQKRPGGRVPPLPEEAERLRNPVESLKAKLPPGTPLPPELLRRQHIPYHEYMNAYWDLEDMGIPFPEKFGKDRRFPAAPMPRAVGDTGLQISQ